MRRCINDQFNFVDRSNKNKNVMSYTGAFGYPIQDTNAVGKYIAINFFDMINQSYCFRVKFPKSTTYEEYKDILPNVYDPKENFPVIFKIVRFDLVYPYRAILVSIYGHLLVTTTEEVNNLLYYEGGSYCDSIKTQIENLGKEMYMYIITTSEENFINGFISEKIHIFPQQYDEIYGKKVWIEYDNDLENVKAEDTLYPVPKNNYEFTDEMYQEVIERDVSLKNKSRKELESYPVYYNTHSQSFMNDPLRSMSIGYVVRCDINDPDGQVVVIQENGREQRFICLDEAKFYYDDQDNTKINIVPPRFYKEGKDTLYDYLEPLTNWNEIKAKIIEDFPIILTFVRDDYFWTNLKASFESIPNATAVAWTMRGTWGTYLMLGFYPSELHLEIKYDGTCLNIPYSVGFFPDGIHQIYNCIMYQGRTWDTWAKQNNIKFIYSTNYFTSADLVKYVNYGR